MARWIVFHLLAAALMMSVTSLPDLTWDTRTEDIVHMMNTSEAEYIRHVRYETEDMPLECRNDICLSKTTYSSLKGDINWPTLPIGKRVYIQCPFAFDEERYAYYDCLLDDLLIGTWTGDVKMDSCPGPPLLEVINQLNLTSFSTNESLKNIDMQQLLKYFRAVHNTIIRFSDSPISSDESEIAVLLHFSERLLQDVGSVDLKLFLEVMDVVDFMLKHADINQMANVIQAFTTLTRLPQDHALLARHALKSKNNRVIFVKRTLNVGQKSVILGLPGYSVTAELSEDDSHNREMMVMYFQPAQVNSNLGSYFEQETGENFNRIFLDQMMLYLSPLPWPGPTNSTVIITQSLTNDKDLDPDVSCAAARLDGGVISSSKGQLKRYTAGDCRMLSQSTCRCQLHSGFISVALQKILPGSEDVSLPPDTVLDEFLGFPFRKELYIVGHVLRAVSLLCLASTLLSYALFRRTRRGRPTLILLNLCTSLALLLVVLYLAEVTAHTRTGCQVANVLRYYLVMVSLLWNGVEAYNMYLMLIKVFDIRSHKLVTKAAVVAWGTPAAVIGIIYAVNQKGFIGGYIDCEFKCFLPERTLYYGYLLPMSLIILHNLVIFSLVLRVLTKSPAPGAVQGERHGLGQYWRQLSGAVAMLVLLGVPWLFSAFGAISLDASDAMKNTEAAFQIIFVLFVNMQGIYIFFFHCVRNVDVRREWKSAVNLAKRTEKPRDNKPHRPDTASTSLSSGACLN